MFVYQNKENNICVTFKDNKPVKSPEYVIALIDGKLVINSNRLSAVEFLKLSNDIVNATATVVDSNTILDLNGHTISIPNDTAGDGVFTVKPGGKLTINGEGVIDGVGNNDWNIAIWANGGDVIINSGTITNKGAKNINGEIGDHYDLVYAKGNSIVEINGGTFIAETPQWTLNKRDNDPCEIIVKGGTFYKYNPAETMTEPGGVTSFVAEGYKVIQDGDWYTVVKA